MFPGPILRLCEPHAIVQITPFLMAVYPCLCIFAQSLLDSQASPILLKPVAQPWPTADQSLMCNFQRFFVGKNETSFGPREACIT